MGIIKATVGAIGGGLADSWLEVLQADNMGGSTLMTTGAKVRKDKRSSNTRGTENVVSNGSIIHVYPNQMMILTDNGRIVDYSAEEGTYEVYLSSMPSMFNGELKASVKETFGRIKFGGTPSSAQKVFFINLQEIKGIKFGTPNAINYFDNFYNAELFLRCHGVYSIKITDPLKFYTECCPRNSDNVQVDDIFTQYRSEFVMALQTAINKMSIDGIRISHALSKMTELAKYLQDALDDEWKNNRGFEIVSVSISNLDYDDESKKLINMRNKGAMLQDANIREGFVQGSVAAGMEAAGSNSAGATQAFMGMGMGMQNMNSMGGFSATNAQQMAQQQQAQQMAQAAAANTWKCSCGADNTGKFCADCGLKKPAPTGSWICSCGAENTGKFCAECGKKMPAPAGSWVCSCGTENTGKFCANCGTKKPE